jgi:hypothetical protein
MEVFLFLFLVVVLPVMPIILLIFAKYNRSVIKEDVLRHAFISGLVSDCLVIFVLIQSTQPGNWGGIIIAIIIIPYLIIRLLSCIIFKPRYFRYNQEYRLILFLIAFDVLLLREFNKQVQHLG